ncbi:hypothetical protein HaLaN_32643, partial [Haematococcus lacustris]
MNERNRLRATAQQLLPDRTRMPSVNHPHLHHRAASNEPDARRCVACGLTSAAKNKDGFVMVKRVGKDACCNRALTFCSVLGSSRGGKSPVGEELEDCTLCKTLPLYAIRKTT